MEGTDSKEHSKNHVCHHCGHEVWIPKLEKAEKAYCPRCKSFLKSGGRFSFQTSLVLSITSLILLVLSLPFDFLGFNANGREQAVSLWMGMHDIFHHDRPLLAITTFSVIVLMPAVVLLSSVLLFVGLCKEKCEKTFPLFFRITYYGGSWAMAEVFLVGVLVSLTKISSLATIKFGPSFFVYGLFVIFFAIAMGNLDRERLWEAWEEFGGGKV